MTPVLHGYRVGPLNLDGLRAAAIRITAARDAVSTSAYVAVRDAAAASEWPTAAGTVTITHPHAFDQADADGARAVTITALVYSDSVWSIKTWTIPLETSPTADTTYPGAVLFIYEAWVSELGDPINQVANVGDIQMDVGTPTFNGLSTLSAGIGTSRQSQFWVPPTHYLMITDVAWEASATMAVLLRWRLFPLAAFDAPAEAGSFTPPTTAVWRRSEHGAGLALQRTPNLLIPPGAQFEVRAKTTAEAAGGLTVGIGGRLIPRSAVVLLP